MTAVSDAASIVYLHLDDPMVPGGKVGTSLPASQGEKSVTMTCAGECGLDLTFRPDPVYKVLAASCAKCRPEWRTTRSQRNTTEENQPTESSSEQKEKEAAAVSPQTTQKTVVNAAPATKSPVAKSTKSDSKSAKPEPTKKAPATKKITGRRVKGRVNMRGLD